MFRIVKKATWDWIGEDCEWPSKSVPLFHPRTEHFSAPTLRRNPPVGRYTAISVEWIGNSSVPHVHSNTHAHAQPSNAK